MVNAGAPADRPLSSNLSSSSELGDAALKQSVRTLWLLPLAALILYSITMVYIEATTSQDHVRLYFTDIGMPFKHGFFAAADGRFGYGINTSLSSLLLGCSGVLMFLAAFADRQHVSRQASLFAIQGAIFIYLSFDDRLMLHERLGGILHTYSSLLLILVFVMNIGFYLWLFRPSFFNARMVYWFAAASVLFVVMMIFDDVMPHYMPCRLSLEDLMKTWAGFSFLNFAWEAVRFRLVGQPRGEQGYRVPRPILKLTPKWLRPRLTS
ncbi:hypothetical protein ACUXST_001504 [Sphingomonas sp. F9_3S_D5_B_2]